MQDADLFVGLAGIAGVFVGFAALIAVRSGGPTDPLEVAPMRMIVSMAMLTIVAGAVIPGPLTLMPTASPAVLSTVIVADPSLVELRTPGVPPLCGPRWIQVKPLRSLKVKPL